MKVPVLCLYQIIFFVLAGSSKANNVNNVSPRPITPTQQWCSLKIDSKLPNLLHIPVWIFCTLTVQIMIQQSQFHQFHQAQASCKIDNLQTTEIARCKVLTFFARVAVVDDYHHTREQIKLKILILGGSRQFSVGVRMTSIFLWNNKKCAVHWY